MRYVLAIAFLLAVSVSLLGSVTSAFADPGVSVDIPRGGVNDTYIYSGTGFAPGTALKGKYTTPANTVYTIDEGAGVARTFLAKEDGTWEYTFAPKDSVFSGAPLGRWTLSFCLATDPTACWSASIRVEASN